MAGRLLVLSTLKDRKKTLSALITSGKVTLQVLPVLFFIFVLMGTIEAFVSKATIARLLGEGSGVLGILLAEAVGSVALIQPAAVFPFSGYLRTTGASYGTVAAFVLAAILIGVTTLPLEIKLFGPRFILTRNVLSFVVIFFPSCPHRGDPMRSLTKTAVIYIALGGAIWGLSALLAPARGAIVGEVIKSTFIQTIEIILAVFIFIGLLQVWVPPATIAKLLGKGSGWKGLALASTVPLAIGGSLFTILPLVQALIEKGARLAVAGAFITAWAGKLPLIPLEIHFLGWRFALVRLGLLIPSAIIIGLAWKKSWKGEEKRHDPRCKSPGFLGILKLVMSTSFGRPLLVVENLFVEREGRTILQGVDLSVEEGEIHAILGANGTGKSTLAYAIMGLSGYKSKAGRIIFSGEDITEKSVTERAKLGITLAWQQPASFEGLTIREYLEISRRAGRGCSSIEECLALVGLYPKSYMERTLNDRLSGGERKRVELAAVLAMRPRLAILDEPDSGIDVLSLDDIMKVIRRMNREGTTVLLITHREEFARAAHRASHLCGGRILKTGECEEVVRFYKNFCKECTHVNEPEYERLEARSDAANR